MVRTFIAIAHRQLMKRSEPQATALSSIINNKQQNKYLR
jgi:hypothetical protein